MAAATIPGVALPQAAGVFADGSTENRPTAPANGGEVDMTLPRAGWRSDPLLVGLILLTLLVPPIFGLFGMAVDPLVAQTAYWAALTACSVGWA
ncbi:MAG: hypothetical protein ABW022_21535, partial [Actinoplanes sp.]